MNENAPNLADLKWLRWAQQLQALAQSGLQYTTNLFDIERYQKISRLAAEIMADGAGAELRLVNDVFDAQAGYATPKVDVRGVVFHQEKLLFVRELMDGGKWTLPGGWVDINESPSQAVEREVREEAGLIVKARKLLALYDRNLHGHPPYAFHTYKIFMLCDWIDTGIPSPLETSEPTFFAADEIPQLSVARVTREEVERMFDHLHLPDLPTDFD
jgi:ADP-ribose pyrophosphatase YjhB (NUDIX family)